nr:hypothetical protein [Tanacetum cinerariifolium]
MGLGSSSSSVRLNGVFIAGGGPAGVSIVALLKEKGSVTEYFVLMLVVATGENAEAWMSKIEGLKEFSDTDLVLPQMIPAYALAMNLQNYNPSYILNRHGRAAEINAIPVIKKFNSESAVFGNGVTRPIDAIVFAIGYRTNVLDWLQLMENKLESMKILDNKLELLKLLENKLESMMILENKLELMKILDNKLELLKLLENKLESMKLQENQPSVFDLLVVVRIISAIMMSADVARGHGGDSGGDDRPLHIRPSLTCVPTWNPTAGHKSIRSSNNTYKRSTMARRRLSKKYIGFQKRTRLMTWSASDANVPRTFPT